MGLGKKLGQFNQTTEQQLQFASAPVAEAGFNSDNIPHLQPSAMSNLEVQQVRQLTAEAAMDSQISNQNIQTNLRKPDVPIGQAYPNKDVSKLVVEKMWRIISLRRLHNFYTQEKLQTLVNRACKHDYKILMSAWNLPTIDMAVDLAVLGLYDIVILGDDSGSMATTEPTEDNMSRWEILKNVMQTIGFWAILMDADGIVIRFLNSEVEANGVSTMQEINQIFSSVRPRGGTPIGEKITQKVFNAIAEPLGRRNELERPILLITLTDGIPDSEQAVMNGIKSCKNFFSSTKYGEFAMAFSFAQIGTDKNATEFLGRLDKDAIIGKLIDCTSEYSIEKKECGPGFSEAVWVVKSMIGAVDPSYDEADEKN
jgi:hypothetical protein